MPLRKWFWAICLCVTDKRGRSALALSRQIGCHAAWLMLHKPREAMSERDFHCILSGAGIPEADPHDRRERQAYIMSTYHGLDAKHLQAYLDEFCYRFNRRFKQAELFSRTLAACADGPWLTYDELTA